MSLGFGVLLLFSVGAIALSYATYKSSKRNQPVDDVTIKKSKSMKYKVSQGSKRSSDQIDINHCQSNGSVSIETNNGLPRYSTVVDNMGFVGEDEDDTSHVEPNGNVPEETNNRISVIS